MKAKEFKAIAVIMRDFGITHFKSEGFELVMGVRSASVPDSVAPVKKRKRRTKAQMEADKALDSEPVPHVVNELTSIMKLGDNELVDLLFPEPTEEAG